MPITAQALPLVSAEETISGLTKAIKTINTATKKPVPFPRKVPKSNKPLFAELEVTEKHHDKQYWMITVTTEPGCFAKTCIVGLLSATANGKLDTNYIQFSIGGEPKRKPKTRIKLSHGVTAYFTPDQIGGDWHPPTLEWQKNGILYYLSWNIDKNAHNVLKKMASSIPI